MFVNPLPGGGLRITGATLKNLISIAYNVREFQISGGPQWVEKERFDIDARAAASDGASPADAARLRERIRSLLADRFQLAQHSEIREQPVYSLVVAKSGSKLQDSKETRSLIRLMGRGTLKGQSVGVGMLALNLSNQLGRRVIDKTGLDGKYDFELKWTTDPSAAPLAPGDPDGPSIFTALQEQLGLRLEADKGAVEILVIDKAERPSNN